MVIYDPIFTLVYLLILIYDLPKVQIDFLHKILNLFIFQHLNVYIFLSLQLRTPSKTKLFWNFTIVERIYWPFLWKFFFFKLIHKLLLTKFNHGTKYCQQVFFWKIQKDFMRHKKWHSFLIPWNIKFDVEITTIFYLQYRYNCELIITVYFNTLLK